MAVAADGAAQRARQLESVGVFFYARLARLFWNVVQVGDKREIGDARQEFI